MALMANFIGLNKIYVCAKNVPVLFRLYIRALFAIMRAIFALKRLGYPHKVTTIFFLNWNESEKNDTKLYRK